MRRLQPRSTLFPYTTLFRSPPSCVLRSASVEGDAKRYEPLRSEEHTSELQSRSELVCRLLLEKKKPARLAAEIAQLCTESAGTHDGIRRWAVRSSGTAEYSACVVFFNDTATTEIYTLSLHDALPITVPSMPGGTRNELSFTSDAFSPKIARSSFSSGVSCDSPFGVTLPTRMSPTFTSAPMYTMPDLSRRFSACSPTFGMSAVISSGPSLVSRAWQVSSSMWIEV